MADDTRGSRWSVGDERSAADALARIHYDVPAGFTESTEGKVTMLDEPTREIAFFITRANAGNAEQATAEINLVLSALFKDVKPAGEPVRRTYNGMPGLQTKATCTYEGKPVNVTIRFLEAEPGKFVVVAGAYLAAKKEALKDTFNAFFQSIKPAA